MMDATPSNSSVDEDAVETGPVSDAVRTELKQLFDIYDIDKNGVLTVDELRNAMSSAFLFDAGDNLSPEASAVTTLDFERIVMSSDMNGDNEIDFEEWIHLMRHFFE
jgi:Ca2+-binding EF-hand superfamily protein